MILSAVRSYGVQSILLGGEGMPDKERDSWAVDILLPLKKYASACDRGKRETLRKREVRSSWVRNSVATRGM